MGMLRKLLTLPVRGPFDGALWVAGKVHETATRELNDPATIRRQLQALETALLAGEIDEDTYDALETSLLERMRAQSG